MEIAVIGSITRDRIIVTSRNEEYSQTGGGVYYASLALANVGTKVVAIPLLSKNDSGLLDPLDHQDIKVVPQWTNDTTAYQNTYSGGSLDICDKRVLSKVSGYYPGKELFDVLSTCDAVHLTPLSAEEFDVRLFPELRRRFSRTISLDGQGFTKGDVADLRTVLVDNIDVIKLDETEATQVTGQNDEDSAIRTLAGWGISQILITKASRGSILYFNGDTHFIPAYEPDNIIDPTGCGDTYIAGYLAKLVAGAEPLDAAYFASRLAAKKLEYKGALPAPDGED